MTLKSLEEHNKERRSIYEVRQNNDPCLNGIACPECGAESTPMTLKVKVMSSFEVGHNIDKPIKQCPNPWCNAPKDEGYDIRTIELNGEFHQRCGYCYTPGPPKKTIEESIDAWNSRINENLLIEKCAEIADNAVLWHCPPECRGLISPIEEAKADAAIEIARIIRSLKE